MPYRDPDFPRDHHPPHCPRKEHPLGQSDAVSWSIVETMMTGDAKIVGEHHAPIAGFVL